jgi:hypothetical protein
VDTIGLVIFFCRATRRRSYINERQLESKPAFLAARMTLCTKGVSFPPT